MSPEQEEPAPPADPFVTEAEFVSLYPERASEASESVKRAREVCGRCAGECCRVIACVLYSPQFRACPIYEFRPLGCRVWFCRRVAGEGATLTADEVQELQAIAWKGDDWLPQEIRGPLMGQMAQLRAGLLSAEDAVRNIQAIVSTYWSRQVEAGRDSVLSPGPGTRR